MSETAIQPITCPEPGIYRISEEEYHGDPCPVPSLSASFAVNLLEMSPAEAVLTHPRLTLQLEREEKACFDLGSACHEMLLEQSGERIAVCEYDDWRTNAAKMERDEARRTGRYPILAKQLPAVEAMAKVARAYIATTEFAGIFENGQPEQAVIWKEEDIWCRSKTDWLSIQTGKTIVLDYKTTESTIPAWIRGIGRDNRDVQAVFYPRGLSRLSYPKPQFFWLVQRVVKPYACRLVGLSEPRKEIANWKLERAIAKWRKYSTAEQWPAYDGRTIYPEPEGWESKEYTEALAKENDE
jgi:hypothetical protein